jgi:tetratricopeptide (TPR) repeat protein
MIRSVFCTVAALFAATFQLETAAAQTPQQIDWCVGKQEATPDLVIGGCTAVIQSGKFQPKQLSLALKLRGEAFRRKGEDDKALVDFDQAIKLNSENSGAFAARGLLFDSRKQSDRAVRDLAAATRIDPNNATAWAYQGDVLYHAGKEAEAIGSFARALKIAPDWMWPANDRGELYADRGDYELALRDFNHVVKVSSTYAMGWNNRCRVNAILGRLDEALKDCDQALKISPKFVNSMVKSGKVSARQHRGFVQLKAGRYDQAVEDYTLALEILSNAETLFGRGIAKAKKGEAAAGDVDIAEARALDPNIAQKFARFGVKL